MFYSSSINGFYDRTIHGDAIPTDAVEITTAEHAALINGQSTGKRIVADSNGYPMLADPPPPTPEQLEALLTAAVQARLDAFAQSRGYDDIKSLVTYAGDPDPVFAAEAAVGVHKRSETWAAMRQIKAAVLAGDWPTAGAGQMPQTIGDIDDALPAMEWPA